MSSHLPAGVWCGRQDLQQRLSDGLQVSLLCVWLGPDQHNKREQDLMHVLNSLSVGSVPSGLFTFTFTYPLTTKIVGAPQIVLRPVFFNFSLFSTAPWDLPNSRPVHSLMLSSHLFFFCLPCLLPPFSVPCKKVLARPDERETYPYHFSLHVCMFTCLFTCLQKWLHLTQIVLYAYVRLLRVTDLAGT